MLLNPNIESLHLYALAKRNVQAGICSEERKLFIIKLANQRMVKLVSRKTGLPHGV